jgi:hypothetical protein
MTAVSAEASGARGTPSGNPDVPEAGQLVRVRGQQWVVSSVSNAMVLHFFDAATASDIVATFARTISPGRGDGPKLVGGSGWLLPTRVSPTGTAARVPCQNRRGP